MKNSDMPAMPMFSDNAEPCIVRDPETGKKAPATGLTKREMMAMHVMASIITQGSPAFIHAAEDAVNAADALLAELERTK